MKGYNIIVVYNEGLDKILMCKRKRDPYKGLFNFVGGKIEDGEKGLQAAYRELEEETAITKGDIKLTHFMDLTYYMDDLYLEVYVGTLHRPVSVAGDENTLCWQDADNDFFDVSRYAGNGNIGHILREIELKWER